MNKKEGVSLIVLVVTIIVMVIISGAVIYSIVEPSTIEQAGNAVNKTNEKLFEEEIKTIESNYMMAYGMENLSAATKNELEELVTTTGIDVKKFTVYYDKLYRRDYIFYRLDRVTLEDVRKIEAIRNEDTTIKYYFLVYDTNLDGVLTKKDVELAESMQQNNIHNFVVDYIISPGSYVAYNSETQKVEQPSSNLSSYNLLFSDIVNNGQISFAINQFMSDVSSYNFHKESKSGTAYYTFANQYADEIEAYNQEHSGT